MPMDRPNRPIVPVGGTPIRRQSAVTVAAIIAVAVSQLVAPDATAAPARAGGPSAGAITIEVPAPGAVVPRESLSAAKAAHVAVLATIGGGVRVTSTSLNGSSVHGVRVVGNRLIGSLAAADGLRPGVNKLRIEGTRPGVRLGVNAVSSFVVTYPGHGLVQLTVPAAAPGTIPAPRLQLPDAGVQSVSVSINGRDVTSAVSHVGCSTAPVTSASRLPTTCVRARTRRPSLW